jgi:type II secretory pathway pseudopilin PulG
MTITDVVVAFTVLCVVSAAVLPVLVNGERIRGHRNRVTAAVIVAQSEVEMLRKQARYGEIIEDTTYSVQQNNQDYVLIRSVEDSQDPLASQTLSRTVSLCVVHKTSRDTMAHFKLLQGYW